MTIVARFSAVALVAVSVFAGAAEANARDVTVVNKTRYPIVSLRMRGNDTHKWSNDLLAEEVNGYVKLAVIPVGASKHISLTTYSDCHCDLFIAFADGHRIRLSADFCKDPTVQIRGN